VSSTTRFVSSDSSQNAPAAETEKRRLVYSGDVHIEVKDFTSLEKDLPATVERLGGFIASYSESRRDRTERGGTWILRIPADQFQEMLTWLDSNYYVVEKSVKSKDVTEEFVDLQARLSNKRKTELRLAEHLAKSASNLTEILQMEKEIERVREEIERVEGRLNYLRDQSELSTITLRAESRAAFVAAKSPSFLGEIGMVFSSSWWTIGQIVYGLIVAVVALLPFAIVLSAIGYLVYFFTGQSPTRIFKRWRERQKNPIPPKTTSFHSQ
jgi:hypothetical protein